MSESLQESVSIPWTEATSCDSFTVGGYFLEESSSSLASKQLYRFLDSEELKHAHKQALQDVMTLLEIEEGAALRLLRKNFWNFNRATEKWFADPEGVKQELGLIGAGPSSSAQGCPVCFGDEKLFCIPCGHGLCSDCWMGYFRAAVEDGPSCLDIVCPIHECVHYVPLPVICEHAREEDVAKFEKYSLRSYVDDNPQASWCPGVECGRAAVCAENLHSTEMMDIHCDCGTVSCFKCHQEGHRPVDCDMISEWTTKIASDGCNQLYILANTKPCPKCKVSIEKNQGCMHMTCSQCKHQFCWICSHSWYDHNNGGLNQCNGYERREGQSLNEEEERRMNAKNAIERFTHYFERWTSHAAAHNMAVNDIAKTHAQLVEVACALAKHSNYTNEDFAYVIRAWEQVVECRRILKYSYVYGYYKFDEDVEKDKKAFFEFVQGDAEHSLERLHDLVEGTTGQLEIGTMKESGALRERHPEEPSFLEDIADTRSQLILLTDVTGKFFSKLVDQLEKGFEEIEERVEEGEKEVKEQAEHPAGQQVGDQEVTQQLIGEMMQQAQRQAQEEAAVLAQ